MNALQKIKLSKELLATTASLNGGKLKALEKIKASKRALELVALLGGGSAKPDTSKYDGYIKIAADSIAELRLLDVDRVLEESGLKGDELSAFGDYIIKNRPDLIDFVKDSISEINAARNPITSFVPTKIETPKELFLKEANAKRQEIDESGFSDAVKRISAIIEDVSNNIGTIDEAKKRLESVIWETKNPLKSGEWRSVQSGHKFYFENMEYGAVVDTRKEGRSNSSDPWRTSDGQYFTGLREAKAHELESSSKQRLINDGYMDGVKVVVPYVQPSTKDFTPLLDGIINDDINVFTDQSKLDELEQVDGVDPELLQYAAVAAARQVLIGLGESLA